MFIPKSVQLDWEQLGSSSDPLSNLRSLEVLGDWIADMKIFVAGEAQEAGISLAQIGEVQNQPRQAVHRKLKSAQSRGFTDPEFDGRDSSTLRYWYDWLNDPQNQKALRKARRDPVDEARRIFAELEARYDAGILRKPPGGLKGLRNG